MRSTDSRARYRRAVEQLVPVLEGLRPSPTASDEPESDRARRVDDGVEHYLAASRALFHETLDHDPDAALASLGGDWRLLAELAATDGVAVTAADRAPLGSLGEDMAAVLAVAESSPRPHPVAVVADDDAVAGALASIDGIVATGREKLVETVTAAVLPNVAELPVIVGSVFGPVAGELFSAALAALQGWASTVVRAATSILRTIVDKIASVFGADVAGRVREWVEGLLDPGFRYDRALGVPALRARAAEVLGGAPDAATRAARIAAAQESHDRCQRWVGWGAIGLAWVGPRLVALPRWGPALAGVSSVALVLGCVWLTADHLDPADLAWMPDRFPGVGAALS